MHSVRINDFWVPRSNDVKIRICADIPNKELIWEQFQAVLAHHKLDMGITKIKDARHAYLLSIIATLEPSHTFFTKGYVKPIKEKKKVNDDDDVLMNSDGFWNDIPDERNPSKHCRIFIK